VAPDSDPQPRRWHEFVAFWFFAGVLLITIGIVMIVTVRHGDRVGAVAALLGIICVGAGNLVRLAGRRG
jgi:threonine/homoserine/homoserine lactone efflux protein